MELKKRTIAKALTWQIIGLIMMTLIGYVSTGSIAAAGGIVIASFSSGTVTYFLHERIWARVNWGRIAPR
ncbi:MAG: putative membrane protein [Sulfitobacter sp.]|jgi:uncharacterized membrane protein